MTWWSTAPFWPRNSDPGPSVNVVSLKSEAWAQCQGLAEEAVESQAVDGRVQSGPGCGVCPRLFHTPPAHQHSSGTLPPPPGFALMFVLCSRYLKNANVSYNKAGKKNAKLGWGRQQGIPRGIVLETVGSILFEARSVDRPS